MKKLDNLLFGTCPIQEEKVAEIAKLKRQGRIMFLIYLPLSLIFLLNTASNQELWQALLVWAIQYIPVLSLMIYGVRKQIALYTVGAPKPTKEKRLTDLKQGMRLGGLVFIGFVFGTLLDRSFDDNIPLLELLKNPILIGFSLLGIGVMLGFFYLIAKSQIDDEFKS